MELKKIVNAIRDYFKVESPQPQQEFPVYLAWNGYDFRPEWLNEVISTQLEKYWETAFYDAVNLQNPNIVVYSFRVYNLINRDLRRSRLLTLTRIIGEKALKEHFQNLGYYNVTVDKFIATNLQADHLWIAIARNEQGFAEIDEYRKRIH